MCGLAAKRALKELVELTNLPCEEVELGLKLAEDMGDDISARRPAVDE